MGRARKKKRSEPAPPSSEVSVETARPPEEPAAPIPHGVAWAFLLGGATLLLGGVAALLYPTLLTVEEFRAFIVAQPYLPLWAVAVGGTGAVLLVRGFTVAGGPQPTWAPDAIPDTGVARKWRELNFIRVWKELDREAAADRERDGGRYDYAPVVVFATGAVFLALMEYYGHAPAFRDLLDIVDPLPREDLALADTFFARLRDSPFASLLEFAWWSGWRVLGFFLLPAFVLRVFLRRRVVEHGLQTRGFLSHAWIYIGALVFVLGLVVTVSYEESFQTYYPFYRNASRSWYDFWTWEVLYAAQFFSLEFFFRGFWTHASRKSMGSHAIWAMTVPYVMIHFGKPFPETIAAIFAGLALGTLALRTRSIWSGFLIHVSVAISMDLAALLQTRGLPTSWWPEL